MSRARLSLVHRTPERSKRAPRPVSLETQLLIRAREGDNEAFAAIYQMHRKAVLATCLRKTLDAQIAEDAVQDTCLRAYASLSGFDESRSLLPWLQQVAVRRCIDLARRTSKLEVMGELEDPLPDSLDEDPPLDAAIAADTRRRLASGRERIPQRQRRALSLSGL